MVPTNWKAIATISASIFYLISTSSSEPSE